jgi:hypothetical protein
MVGCCIAVSAALSSVDTSDLDRNDVRTVIQDVYGDVQPAAQSQMYQALIEAFEEDRGNRSLSSFERLQIAADAKRVFNITDVV